MRRKLAVFLSCALLCGLFTGCSEKEEPEAPIKVAVLSDLVSLDLAVTRDTMSETVGRCLFSTLYTFDENLDLIPCLAQGETRVSDLVWEFQLRQDAKFHDGTDVKASDVVFSLERAIEVNEQDKLLHIIESAEALDDYTLRVTTTEPVADLRSVFVRVNTSVMSEQAVNQPDYDFDHPVGSGPYQMVERKPGESIALERFDGYFGEPAKNKYLTFLVDNSPQSQTASLLNHTVDVIQRVSAADCDYLKLEDGVEVYETDSTKMELLALNTTKDPFQDVRVREAIFHAIDRQKLLENVNYGHGALLNSMAPPPVLGAIEFDGFAYDPEKSKALLREAGYEDGLSITADSYDEVRKQMLEYIRLDLAQVGIQLDYEFHDQTEFLDLLNNNGYAFTFLSWTSNPDPDSTFAQLYSKNSSITVNHSHFTDPRVEELILEGKRESDPEKRRAIYEEANEIIAGSYCVLPLFRPSMIAAAGEDIQGVRMNAQGLFGYEYMSRARG